MTRVYLIRHGRPETTWGGADVDPGLDDQGRAQARLAAEALLALRADLRPDRVVSSPLRRCRETAAPLAAALGREIEIDPRIAEIPTPSGLSAEERGPWLRAAFTGRWGDIPGDLDYRLWREGVLAAALERPGGAVFTHFVAINAAVSAANGSDLVRAFEPDHASITAFEVEGDGLRLIELGRSAETRVL